MDFAPYIFERDSLCNTRFCLEKAKFRRKKWVDILRFKIGMIVPALLPPKKCESKISI